MSEENTSTTLNSFEDKKVKRPPLGLKPKWLHDEQRLAAVTGAISRYTETKKEIPSEWLEEYNYLVTIVLKRK